MLRFLSNAVFFRHLQNPSPESEKRVIGNTDQTPAPDTERGIGSFCCCCCCCLRSFWSREVLRKLWQTLISVFVLILIRRTPEVHRNRWYIWRLNGWWWFWKRIAYSYEKRGHWPVESTGYFTQWPGHRGWIKEVNTTLDKEVDSMLNLKPCESVNWSSKKQDSTALKGSWGKGGLFQQL